MGELTRRRFLGGRLAGQRAPQALERTGGPPLTLKASIGTGCLALHRVLCSACGERCEARAIRFRPAPGIPATPAIDLDRCTGCGACVAACPVSAITVSAITVSA